jgi:hypothetical protein
MKVDINIALEIARQHKTTPKEMYEQRISWIRGMSGKLLDPMPTREEVVKRLAEFGIFDPEAQRQSGDEGSTNG